MNDWTTGTPAMLFQHCPHCEGTWYFARRFCPHCGAAEPQARNSAGRGQVYALTTVVRAPSAELRALAPYRIALVDMDEGFRAMTHAGDNVALGDRVQTHFVTFGSLTIPHCDRVGADT
jgi:uncharacterized OB-fold protein